MVLRTALVVAWSSGFVGAALGTSYAAADTLLAWRYLVAAPVLLGLAMLLHRGVTPALLVRQAVVGLLAQCTYLGGVVYGVALGVSAGTAALVGALQPLVVSVAAAPLLAERTSGRQRVGMLLGIGGVALVVGSDIVAGSAPAWAYLLPVVGMLGLSAGSVLDRRWGARDDLLVALAVQTAVAAVVFTVLAGVLGRLSPPHAPGFWWAVAWVVVLSTFGGYGAYLGVLRREGATRVSALLYLTPPTTALWAWGMFGEPPGVLTLPGLLVCALAVTLVLRSPRSASHYRGGDADVRRVAPSGRGRRGPRGVPRPAAGG